MKSILRYPPFSIALIFLVISVLWIYFSDLILLKLYPEIKLITKYQTIKGLFFVFSSALLIFLLILKHTRKKNRLIKLLNNKNDWYNLLLTKIPSTAIFIFDEDLKILLAQGSEVFRHGFVPERIVGKKLDQLDLSSVNKKILHKYFHQILEQDQVLSTEIKFREDFYQINGLSLKDKGEKSQSMAGVIVAYCITKQKNMLDDLTIQKNKYKELNRQHKAAKEKAEQSDRLKSSFLAVMSHELRTPLNAILGFSELIQMENLSREEIGKYNERIYQSGEHLKELINSIFDASTLLTGEVTVQKTRFSLTELCQNLIHTTRQWISRFDKHNLDFIFENIDENKNYELYTDRTKLNQALLNLLNNSVKFTRAGSIKFGYRVQHHDILFYVSDTGIGIAEEKTNEIFEKFRMLDDTDTRMQGGVGLGLTISKQIATLLGATLWVDSAPGKGATFYLKLPKVVNNISDNFSVKRT